MHDLLFGHRTDLTDPALLRYAAQAGADVGAVSEAMSAGAMSARIQRDVKGGLRSGVGGRPTFFGLRHDGSWDLESLAERLTEELAG